MEFAKEQQARWGCPAAGKKKLPVLPRDLLQEAEHTARLTQTPVADTCPLACVKAADPWVVELTHAIAAQSESGIPISEKLGRDLTLVDLTAIDTLKRAQNDAYRSDRDIAQQHRDAAEQQRKQQGLA